MSKYVVLRQDDNVAVAIEALKKGELPEIAGNPVLREDIPAGHKFSTKNIPAGSPVRKYGVPIGHATADIPPGAWVHVHNVKTNLEGEEQYCYNPAPAKTGRPGGDTVDIPAFKGFRRPNGKAGIRNEIWVVPTVGCTNRLVQRLADRAGKNLPGAVDAVVAFPHPYGCSQLGEDHETTRTILANMARHPNCGGILYVGLGCENNTMRDFIPLVESHDDRNPNIRYLVAQDVEDELAAGDDLLVEIIDAASGAERVDIPVGELCVGMKCGASDGLSGVTANPLLGAFADWLVERGGRVVLTEVPEMFGAERTLLNRAADREVFDRGVKMINDFKNYYLAHGQPVYENPSPGNKEGGITTAEDKSIGCTQKGGTGPVVDIQPYGGMITKPGVTLLSGPGNDLISVSAMAVAGAQILLFSTGRGNPLGSPVPVVKVSSNATLAARKPHWIDFDASPLSSGTPMARLLPGLVKAVLAAVSGQKTRNEIAGMHDFSIFKDGVIL